VSPCRFVNKMQIADKYQHGPPPSCLPQAGICCPPSMILRAYQDSEILKNFP
jgi:hypothetical protein